MTSDEKRGLVDFARKLAGMQVSSSETGIDFEQPAPDSEKVESPPQPEKKADTILEEPALPSKAQDTAPTGLQNMQGLEVTTRKKQLRTPNEIAKLILDTLRTIEGCAERGFLVTVYGSNPWNAMLTIRPEAGPVIDGPLWLARVREIGVRLRDDFDVIEDTKTDGVRHQVTDVAGAGSQSSQGGS